MILIAFGTRPEIIKLFPVINEMKKRHFPFRTLFTGQQYDLFKDVSDLIPPPDFSFEKSFAGKGKHNTLGMSYAKICRAAEELFSRERFDIVVVQGDTTTALALAQISFYNGFEVAHIEAGLRTYNLENPYPEELNRTAIAKLGALHFAPTRIALDNLKKEHVKNIFLTGNTIVDAVNHFKKALGLKTERGKSVLVTLHRRENHPSMEAIFKELQKTALRHPNLEFIFPIHPNPNVKKHRSILKAGNIHVISPVGYPELLQILAASSFIISDSGGIQEEATCFNKKVLIMRTVTERPEVIKIGLGMLAGREIERHIEWAEAPAPRVGQSPYGDGRAAEKIVSLLEKRRKSEP